MCNLVNKYNVAGPRYTSYPTVPYWDMETFSVSKWKASVQKSFDESNASEGISLYVHLPFCESLCTFCGCNKRITKRHEVEKPYIKTLLKEWALYCEVFESKPIIKEIHLGGGTPTFFSPENLRKLIKGILIHATVANNHEFSFEGHPNNTTAAHLQTLYDLGFRRVCFGVQDYNETVQKAIHRVQPFENVQRVTELARHIGYTSVGHDIIFGLPFQTTEHVAETIAKTKLLAPDRIAFYSYAHVPWIKGNGQRGYRNEDLPTAEEKTAQYNLGKKLLQEADYTDIGMDHFALPTDSLYTSMIEKRLHRNFMGYTAQKTQLMIGLGVSSIGDSWYGFAQNVKNLETYHHLVNEGMLPLAKGHILSAEDLLIRKHILNLMCHFKTTWTPETIQIPELANITEKLAEFIRDELIQIENNTISITKKGKPFVRNICMAFDVLLQRKKPDTQLFSMTI
ncbi:MAG: oxygen-independent coproporphyrinogen III oxidase [Bacteroidota bacterium]